MHWKAALSFTGLALALSAPHVLAAESGPDFIVGTWTRDGDCQDGDVVRRDGAQYRFKSRGQNYVGSVQREGKIIKTDFSAEDGNKRSFVYEITNDNRMRVLDFTLCDQVHCETMHVQSFFYVMRCAE